MGIFSYIDQYHGYNIYSMKKYVDKKRIIFNIVVIILIIITLGMIIYYTVDTKLRLEKTKQYIAQIIEQKNELERIKKEEQERLKKIPQITEQGKQNIVNIYKSESKRAFLTFDDGPSINTKDVLDILKQNNIKATFFVLGNQVEIFPQTTKRIYDEGHYLANHGYSHIYSSIYQTPEQVLVEYNQCNQIIANTIGVPEYNSHLFRFPGGSNGGKYAQIKKEAINLLEQNSIAYLDWNALTGDSEKVDPTEEYLINKLQETTNEKNSVVILMHDSQSKRITVDCLPKVIEYLRQQGYVFEDFYNILKGE